MVDSKSKPYGVKVQLPKDGPFSMPHLLGEDWTGTRWFATAEERDVAMEAIIEQPGNYRKGDKPSIIVTAVDP